MGSALSVVGSILKYAGCTAIGIIIVGAIFLYLTKPDNDTLFTSARSNASFLETRLNSTIGKILTNPQFKDWVILKTAHLTVPGGKSIVYIGILNHWITQER